MEMSTAGQDTGTITKWRERWDQEHFTWCYPNALQALRPYSLLETDVLRTDKVQINIIRRVFEVKPMALLSPQDVHGSGSRFIVGVVSNAGNAGGPFVLNGVMALGSGSGRSGRRRRPRMGRCVCDVCRPSCG